MHRKETSKVLQGHTASTGIQVNQDESSDIHQRMLPTGLAGRIPKVDRSAGTNLLMDASGELIMEFSRLCCQKLGDSKIIMDCTVAVDFLSLSPECVDSECLIANALKFHWHIHTLGFATTSRVHPYF